MTLEDLAKKYKLRIKKDDCGDLYIPGKLGQLYEYDEDVIGAMYMPEKPSKGWTARREALIAKGATVVQNGDMEGAVTMPAQSADLIRLAIKLLRISKKKEISPERRAALSAQLKKARTAKATS